jgi:ankyrin repeat protein
MVDHRNASDDDCRRLHDAIVDGRIEDVERFFRPIDDDDNDERIIVQPDNVIWGGCNSALHVACIYRNLDMVRFLVERLGANVNALVLRTGDSALNMACQYGSLDIVEYLLEGDCGFRWDVNHTNRAGQTALHNASLCSHYNIVHYLVRNQRGVHVDAKSRFADTPLHLAC